MATSELAQSFTNLCSSVANFATWEAAKSLANSAFATALIGSLAGAFAGAVAAQRIVERGKHREELLLEIRNTNAAIAIAFGICNTLVALKKQHVKDLKTRFDAQKAAALEFQRKRKNGEIQDDVEFVFQADLQSLQTGSLPTDILRAVVFERLSLVGRPLNLVMTLAQTAQSLDGSVEKRNALIERYKTEFAHDNRNLTPQYFGFPYGNGHINLEYPGSVEAIYNQTNDGIFFSNLLCKDLHDHGQHLADEFKKKFKEEAPRVSKVDFSTVADLMPDEKDYADWTSAFVKKVNVKHPQ